MTTSSELKRTARDVLTFCGIGNLLQLGCSDAGFITEVVRLGIDAHGADPLSDHIDKGQKRLPGRFHTCNLSKLSFSDESFETVVSLDELQRLPQDILPSVIKEIFRVAKRFAFITVQTVPTMDGLKNTTVENRAYWEKLFFTEGFRKHPFYYRMNRFEELQQDGNSISMLFEKVPLESLKTYAPAVLSQEKGPSMDLLRASGKDSDVSLARYKWAADFIRQGDRVLDFACGKGYGSYCLAESSCAAEVLGIDENIADVNYAQLNFAPSSKKIKFVAGASASCLNKFEDGYFDVIACFDLPDDSHNIQIILKAFHRILSPGGRILVSISNRPSNPNQAPSLPAHGIPNMLWGHLEEHFISEAIFQQVAGSEIPTESGKPCEYIARSLKPIPLSSAKYPPSDWWLMVAMKNPINNSIKYRESVYGYSRPPQNLLNFEEEYKSPWLVRSMLEFHFRATNPQVLKKIATKVLENDGSEDALIDRCAALAVIGYQILSNDDFERSEVEKFLLTLDSHIYPPISPQRLRFFVSLSFLKGSLLKKIGNFKDALNEFKKVSETDIKNFNPSLGTKIIDSSFEAGMLQFSAGNIEEARYHWKHGITRAYSLLSSPIEEFLGILDSPHEFPSIVAVEFLDSAVRCIKALRISQPGGNISATRIFELTNTNWKGMLEDRWRAIQKMEQMILERDLTIASQSRLIEERWDTIQAMESMIQQRDDAINGQRSLIEHRLEVMRSMESLLREKDQIIHSQTQLIDERGEAIRSMEVMIQEKDQTINLQDKISEERTATLLEMEEKLLNQDRTIEEQSRKMSEISSTVEMLEATIISQSQQQKKWDRLKFWRLFNPKNA